ncbi:MAG: flippase-like domain-containing protein [Chloroflexi bacterium]|nr:flippase-like domain-containing protein [Chloroflexota bacterium]
MRRLLVALVILLGVIFLLTRFAEIQNIILVLQRGNLFFLGLALLAQTVWLFNLSGIYQSVYQALGMKEKRAHLVKLATAANFMTVIAPSAGLSAIAVFATDARQHNRPAARVTVACVLFVLFEYLGILVTIVIGLGALYWRNSLHWSQIAATTLLVSIASGVTFLVYLGTKSANALRTALTRLSRIANTIARPFLRHEAISIDQVSAFAADMADGIAVLRKSPGWFYRPLFLVLLNKAILWAVLSFCLMAFKVPVQASTVIGGLGVAHMFLVGSPMPSGVGIVEGALAVALNSLGVPLGDATVVTLAYRGFSFWMPVMVGMVTIRWVGKVQDAADQGIPATGASITLGPEK